MRSESSEPRPFVYAEWLSWTTFKFTVEIISRHSSFHQDLQDALI